MNERTKPLTIDSLLRAAAAGRPAELALADAPNRASICDGEPRRLTWAELDTTVDAVSSALSGQGVDRHDRVAIQLPNIVELVVTILASVRLGAVAVPFPIQHRRHELEHGLRAAGARMIVTAERPDRPDQLETVTSTIAAVDGSAGVAVFGPTSADGVTRLSLDHEAGEPHDVVGSLDDVVTICWTSGTTGVPKGVPRTNAMWLASSRFQVEQLDLSAADRILCPFPVVNMAGIGGMLIPWLMTGAELHLHQPLDLGVFLEQVGREKVTYTVAPPPLLNRLLADEAVLDKLDLSSIRKISSGSAPLDPWMVRGWQERGIEIVNVFGSNEGASLLSAASDVPDPEERARYFRKPNREGIDVRLVDLETNETIEASGRVGELRFRGPTVFDGYLDSTGEEFDDDGFYRTGDLFEWIGDGPAPELLRFVDRAKDIIIRGGMNISAAEVEALVSSHESVAECAAVGTADTDLGERVTIFVVTTPDQEPPALGDIVEHLRRQEIASYKLPERLVLIDELPRNAVGKVTKDQLRRR